MEKYATRNQNRAEVATLIICKILVDKKENVTKDKRKTFYNKRIKSERWRTFPQDQEQDKDMNSHHFHLTL